MAQEEEHCEDVGSSNLCLEQRNCLAKGCQHLDCELVHDVSPFFPSSDDNKKHSPENHSSLLVSSGVGREDSDSGTEEDEAIYQFDKKNRSYSSARRFFNISATRNRGKLKKLQPIESQDSSKDCFTLQFHNNKELPLDTENVPVRKGRSLKESIEPLLASRGLSFNTHSVFLESSKTPLPLAFDTIPLGGNTLHVKANQTMQVDERIVELMKAGDEQQDKKAQSQRQKKNIISLINNEESQSNNKSTSLPTSTSKLARRVGMSSSAKDLSRSLPDLLQQYSNSGFNEDNADSSSGEENLSIEDSLLEDTWTDVIKERDGMTRQEKIQQEAIWELLSTENNYVGQISVILQVFQKCLRNLKREQFLLEVDEEKLFANIHDVFEANCVFWKMYLLQVVEEARRTKEPIKPSQLLDSFAKFEDLFDPYIKYCLEESHCVKYLKHLKHTNEDFAEYLGWCENQSQCHRLKLADLLVKPMQRVTKYALLLRAILGRTIDDDQCLSLENMVSHVERFVTKINTTLRLRHEQQKLDAVLERIESYLPVEAANEEVEKIMLEYCSLNLRQKIPGLSEEQQRCILLDGSMKMIEKQGRFDVQVFLFTDVLLITKPKKGGEKFRVIRPPYRLNKIVVHPSKDLGSFVLIYLNEYGVLVTAFTLQVNANELTKWIQAIRKAKTRYLDARSGHRSTLEFDEDLPSSTTIQNLYVPSRHHHSMSPVPDDRSVNRSDSSLFRNMTLRSNSTSNFADPLHKLEKLTEIKDSSVKRSLSDPKSSVNPKLRGNHVKMPKSRPMSLVQTSDRDVDAPWMFTNEKPRPRSGSIPSDISDDSRRSSGIGDSFRSINSDGGVTNSAKGSYAEISNVQKLKARFENGEYQSDSSSSLTSNGVTETTSTAPVSRSNSNRKSNSVDYMDQHCTIEEEEEQLANHALFASLNSDRDEDDELSSTHEGDSSRTLNEENEEGPYQNFNSLNKVLSRLLLDSTTQTEPIELSRYSFDTRDIGVQCVCPDIQITTCNGTSLENLANTGQLSVVTYDEKSCSNSDLRTALQNAETQCDVTELELENTSSLAKDFTDNVTNFPISTSCDHDADKKPLTKSVSSQCGDFIYLQDGCIGESVTEICSPRNEKNPTDDKNDCVTVSSNNVLQVTTTLSQSTPMLDMLVGSSENKHFYSPANGHSSLSKSYSEANLPQMKEYDNNKAGVKILHSRSQSDEPKPLANIELQKTTDSETNFDSPGMRALISLSESLESSLIRRSATTGSRTDPATNREVATSASPSLRKATMLKNSPAVLRKISSDEQTVKIPLELKGAVSSSSSGSGGGGSPKVLMREQKNPKEDTKRFTWHDFDSVAALERIQSTKYGVTKGQGRDSSFSPISEEPRIVERTFSKSTEYLNSSSPKKQKSFKKSFLKKFSDSRIIEQNESSSLSASVDANLDTKHLKKQQEKEKKEEKKRLKMEKKREKEEKKREKDWNRRNSSHSSLSSSSSAQSTPMQFKSS